MRRFREKYQRHQKNDDAELDITAFLGLMVVLVAFLLVMAVFNKYTVLDLSLAGLTSDDSDPPELTLEVIVREDVIQLANRGKSELLATITKVVATEPTPVEDYDYQELQASIRALHDQYPDVSSAAVLIEDDIAYESVINVVDKVREYVGPENKREALFPDISLGKAPKNK